MNVCLNPYKLILLKLYFIKIICTVFYRNSDNLSLEMRRLPVIGESHLNIVINKSIFGKHARNVFSWIVFGA